MNQVFEMLKSHYEQHNKIIHPIKFARLHKGIPTEDIVAGVLEFDRYLDSRRTEAV